MEKEILRVNNNDVQSIFYCERKKQILENKGYRLLETKQIALDIFNLIYIKE